jgi:arylsulfatase A-like enzyme
MLSSVDRGLGRLFAALEQKGVLDETLLIVTSDQGFFYGEFGLAQERRLAYEASIRIPLLLRYPPRVAAGERRQALASNVDIAPTILELAAVSSPAAFDGVSLLPVLADRDARARKALLIEYYSDTVFPRLRNMGYRAIRTERYKYIRYVDRSGMDEIYDLHNDPNELDNLLPDRVSPTLLAQLGQALDALLEEPAAPGAHHQEPGGSREGDRAAVAQPRPPGITE